MTKTLICRSALIVAACFGVLPTVSYGFGVPTHRAMNEAATRNPTPDGFQLDDFLRQEPPRPFDQGIATWLKQKKVFEWIREGGEREDDDTPYPSGWDFPWPGRYNRHFHDPLIDPGPPPACSCLPLR